MSLSRSESDETPRCIVCKTPRTAWGVCDGCIARVDSQLGGLIEMHVWAGNVEMRLIRANPDGIGPVGGSRERSLGQRVDALDLAHGEALLGPLETWERDWRDTFALTAYGEASGRRLEAARSYATAREVTLVGVVAFLRSWWPRAAEKHPAADEFAYEVRRLHLWAQRALDMAEPRPWTVPCPADLGERQCGYRLQVEYAGRALSLYCPRCGSDWNTDRLLLVAESAGQPVWVDPETAAELFGVAERTLRRMAERGEIQRRFGRYNVSRNASLST